jgi:1-aminocyclopropane-1-carboxylate deaminase/D-cysteine desulfhydrase-like pyridoxal-dependent ACC family enzyme
LAGDSGEIPSGNYALDLLLGAEIVWADRQTRDAALQEVFQKAWEAGKRPFLIPYGGSSPTGAVAYALAMEELQKQNVHPDWIIFPSSSGGTQAGMVVGAYQYGYKGKILGISVDEPAKHLKSVVSDLANLVCDRHQINMNFTPDQILVNDDAIQPGYAVMTDLEKNAMQVFARKAAIFLDPVYTGRAAGVLIQLIQKGEFQKDETVLFWHTGGLPALFADPYTKNLI